MVSGIFPTDIEGFQYWMDIKANSGAQQISNLFQRINLTTYFGAAVMGARLSGSKGTTFSLRTAPVLAAQAELRFYAEQIDNRETVPSNDAQPGADYVELFLKPVITNEVNNKFTVSAFVGYNNSSFYSICRAVTMTSESLVRCNTGGKSYIGEKFDVSGARNMISLSTPLTIIVTEKVANAHKLS